MRLDNRLALTASLVRHASRLVDVGTDHAYLPVWLVEQGICPLAIATDIHRGPAARAAETVADAGLSASISVRLGDGLSSVLPDEIDDIVIAGMGGETIAAILAAAPWAKNKHYHLVLQPMSKPELLREYLLTNGFSLTEEHVAVDGKRIYLVVCARFDPEIAVVQASDPVAYYRGALDPEEGSAYLLKQSNRLKHVASALHQAGNDVEANRLQQLASLLLPPCCLP